jgi:hypothetical protein
LAVFSDRKKPAASATLLSIGQLGVEANKKHAAALYPIIQKYLNVDPKRCYIHFLVRFSSLSGQEKRITSAFLLVSGRQEGRARV